MIIYGLFDSYEDGPDLIDLAFSRQTLEVISKEILQIHKNYRQEVSNWYTLESDRMIAAGFVDPLSDKAFKISQQLMEDYPFPEIPENYRYVYGELVIKELEVRE